MDDAEALKDTLKTLSDTLPLLPERVAAALAEGVALRAAAEEFRQRVRGRQTEAAEILARVESALSELRAQASTQAAQLPARDPAEALADPGLAFEETLFQQCLALVGRQQAARERFFQAFQEAQPRDREGLEAASSALQSGVAEGQGRLEDALEAAVLQAAAFQGTVTGGRASLGDEVERMGAEVEAHRAQGARDIDELTKDLTTLQSALGERTESARESVRVNGERIGEEASRRLADGRAMLEDALGQVQDAIRGLDGLVKKATDEAADARRDLVPAFEDLESRIAPLRQAVESIREAARSVGIAF